MKTRRLLLPVLMLLILLGQFYPGRNIQPVAGATPCDWAQFSADVTVPDGTNFAPGTAFTKTWRLKNIGTCTWTTSYAAVFYSGNQMGAPTVIYLPSNVPPGTKVNISVNMTAPYVSGNYRSYWRLRNAIGTQFGIGTARTGTFFVDINVSGSTSASTGFDFVANACLASWSSGAGTLPCPGTVGDTRGYILKVDAPTLENSTPGGPGLSVGPQTVAGGFVQGIYPAFTVQSGDHFASIVNCLPTAKSCYVNFKLMYQAGSGSVKTFWSFAERYDGLYYNADVDLSSLAGQTVNFILQVSDVSGKGVPSGDRTLWGGARIIRTGNVPVSTIGPTLTFASQPTTAPQPTNTTQPTTGPQPTTVTQPTVVPTNCDLATFVTDVTIPDGTVLAAGQSFTKSWRIKNAGTCPWTSSYSIVFTGGNQMGAPAAVNLPRNVAPGATVDISVNMVAPVSAGRYMGNWKLRNASGTIFGLGTSKTGIFFVDIIVAGPTAPTATLAPSATTAVVSPTATIDGNQPTATFTPVVVQPTSTFTFTPVVVQPTATFTQTVIPPTATFTKTPDLSGCSIQHDGNIEIQLLLLVNTERAKAGLVQLVANGPLEISAGWQSDDMAIHTFLSHTGSDGSAYWDRAVRAGYTGHYGGEIIYYGWGPNTTADTALTWWMNSSPHRAMILGDLNDFGAGYAYCPVNQYHYYTVDFGHR